MLAPKVYKLHSEPGLDLFNTPRNLSSEVRGQLEAQGHDGVLNLRYDGEIAVFHPDQILTLGSNKDVSEFRDYIDQREAT